MASDFTVAWQYSQRAQLFFFVLDQYPGPNILKFICISPFIIFIHKFWPKVFHKISTRTRIMPERMSSSRRSSHSGINVYIEIL
jgi:hypothetical protein